jgi:hypothetical protein
MGNREDADDILQTTPPPTEIEEIGGRLVIIGGTNCPAPANNCESVPDLSPSLEFSVNKFNLLRCLYSMGILIFALLLQVAAAAPQQVQPPAAISGTIVDSTTTAPLAGVQVKLAQVGQAPRNVQTDSRGAFTFSDLTAGRYSLLATHPDYLDQGYGTPPESSMRGATWDFPIAAGQQFQAPIRMLRDATISGRIVDSNRAPLANAAVSPRVLVPQGLGPAILGSIQPGEGIGDGSRVFVQTNDRGEYRMAGLPPGEYYIGAAPNVTTGGRTSTNNAATTYYPGFRSPDQAVLVKVAAGADVQGIDIAIEPLPTLRISGKITNPLVAGLPETQYGYQFILLRRGARVIEVPGSVTSTLPDQALAPDEFELHNVAPGDYELFVVYSARPTNPMIGFVYQIARANVPVVDRDVTGVDVTIVPGIEIKGQIILDESAKAAIPNPRGIAFLLQPADSLPRGYAPGVDSVRGQGIAADGTFVLPNATPGRYFVNVFFNPRQNVYLAAARLGTRDVTTQPFEIDSRTTESFVIEISGQAGTVTGVVTDRDSRPVANARVVFVPPLELRRENPAYKEAVTNPQGQFTVVGLRPGTYTAYAFASTVKERGWFDSQYMAQFAAAGVSVSVERGARLQRDLKLILP